MIHGGVKPCVWRSDLLWVRVVWPDQEQIERFNPMKSFAFGADVRREFAARDMDARGDGMTIFGISRQKS